MKTETFEELLRSYAPMYDLRMVFDDFLTLTLSALSFNTGTNQFSDQNLHTQTSMKYKTKEERKTFVKMFACLAVEMQKYGESDMGYDVLGTVYDRIFNVEARHYSPPWSICRLMAQLNSIRIDLIFRGTAARILDPACKSGRILIASVKENGPDHEYYGIDEDHTRVKMTALNLFLNDAFHSEVMWSDPHNPADFKCSYKLSKQPYGIYRITEKEKSMLSWWNMSSLPFRNSRQVLVYENGNMERIEVNQLKLL